LNIVINFYNKNQGYILWRISHGLYKSRIVGKDRISSREKIDPKKFNNAIEWECKAWIEEAKYGI